MKVLKIYYEDDGVEDLSELEAAEHMLNMFIGDVEEFLGAKILGLALKDVKNFEEGEILKVSYVDEPLEA